MRKLLILASLLLLPSAAFAQSVRYQSQAISSRGLPLSNQNVAVCTQPANTATQPCSPLATLATSTSTTSGGANPLTTDSNGNFFFYAAPGRYTVQIYGPQVGTPFVQPDTVLACDPTGACTHSGTETFTGAINCTIVNAKPCVSPSNPQLWAGSDVGGWINSAMAAAGTNGGTVEIAAGSYSFSTQIVFPNKAIVLYGAGSMETTNLSPTTLTWTGGATPAMVMTAGGNSANSYLHDFGLINTGTGTVGIELSAASANLDNVRIENVVVSGFSTAGIRAGNATGINVTNMLLGPGTVLRNNGINLILLGVSGFQGRGIGLFNQGTLNIQIGDATHQVFKASFVQSDIEPVSTANATDVQILNGESITFDHDYFESDGTGYTIDCPSTATNCLQIGVTNSRFKGAGVGNATTYANHIQLATATSYWLNNRQVSYANPSYHVKNDAAQLTVINNLTTDASTSVAFFNGGNADVSYDSLQFGATGSSGKRIPGKLLVRAGLGETGDLDLSGKVTGYNGIAATQGQGVVPIPCITSQKTESAADTNVLTCTPLATVGSYRIRFILSVSAANAATLGWTATWTDSNGNAQAPTNLSLFQSGTAAPALTFTTSAAGNYYADAQIDVNNAGTNIVIKLTFTGTSFTAKASATVERII